MNQSHAHSILVNKCLIEGSKEPGVILFKRTVMLALTLDGRRKITCGIPGEADIDGMLAPNGRKFCAEVKTGNARSTKTQKRYRAVVESHGGYYCIVRSVEDLLAGIKEARKPVNSWIAGHESLKLPLTISIKAQTVTIVHCSQCRRPIISKRVEADGSWTSEYQDKDGRCFYCNRRNP